MCGDAHKRRLQSEHIINFDDTYRKRHEQLARARPDKPTNCTLPWLSAPADKFSEPACFQGWEKRNLLGLFLPQFMTMKLSIVPAGCYFKSRGKISHGQSKTKRENSNFLEIAIT